MNTLFTKKQPKQKVIKLIPYFLIILMGLIILFFPYSNHAFWTGYDTYFHMNGFYEDAMQIKTGKFSYFLSIFGFDKSGRIVNALYGPIFNYLCGALLLICHSWICFEFTLFLITLIISGIGTYLCSRTLKMSLGLSMILALLEMVSPPIVIMWLSYFTFTGLGAAVLIPYVLLIGIKIVQRHQIRIIPLSVMMAICLQIHLMTSLIAALILLPLVLTGWSLSHHRWLMIRNGLASVVLSVILSGNIWGALYDVFSSNHLIPTFPNFNLRSTSGSKALSFQYDSITVLGSIYTFLLLMIIVLAIIKWRLLTAFDKSLLFDMLLCLWLSSKYFPWNRLVKIWPSLASVIQYPVRFSAVTFIMILLLIGSLISKFSGKLKYSFIIGLVFVLALAFHSVMTQTNRLTRVWRSPRVVDYWTHHAKRDDFHNCRKPSQIRCAFRSHNLSRGINVVHKVTTDYLPTPQQLQLQDYYSLPLKAEYAKAFRHSNTFQKLPRKHGLMIDWSIRHSRNIFLPLVKYGYTRVMLNHHLINPRRSLIGTIKVKAHRGSNQLMIYYQPSRYFYMMSIISILGWLGILVIVINRIRFKLKP